MARHHKSSASFSLSVHPSRSAAVARYVHATSGLPPAWVRPGCIESMSQMMSALAPQLAIEDLAVVVQVGLAIFAFDDLVDEADLAVDALALRADQLCACAAGRDCPEVAFDPLARLLRGIGDRLRAAPLGQVLWPQWTHAIADSLHAMVEQRRLAERLRAGGVVSLTEHCAAGSASYGLAAVAIAAWMLMGDAALVSHMPTLCAAERRFALAVRLANDLRSAPRERDGRSCNVLFLASAPSRSQVRAWIDRSLAEGRQVLDAVPVTARPTASLLGQLAHAIVALYAQGDFGEPVPAAGAPSLHAAA